MFKKKVTQYEHDRAVTYLRQEINNLSGKYHDLKRRHLQLLTHLGLEEHYVEPHVMIRKRESSDE